MTFATVVILAVVVLVVLAVAVPLAVLGARRGRAQSPPRLPAASQGQAPMGFVCPFCRRPYDPGRTGGRCPACGAAAPRK